MTYATIQPPFTLKLREMPKKELHRYYQWFMDVLPQRVNELAEAVKQTPGFETWQPDCTPASLDTLGEWFASQGETRNRTQEEFQAIKNRLILPMDIPDQELTNLTFSLATDVGMYLSQVLLRNYPSLKWEQPLATKSSPIMVNHCLTDLDLYLSIQFASQSPSHMVWPAKIKPANDSVKFTITGRSGFNRVLNRPPKAKKLSDVFSTT